MKKIVIGLVCLVSSFQANAACTRANLNGIWFAYAVGGNNFTKCVFNFPATGSVTSARCFDASRRTWYNTRLTMTLASPAYCEVVGSVVSSYVSASFIGRIDAGKTTMIGGYSANDGTLGSFSANK